MTKEVIALDDDALVKVIELVSSSDKLSDEEKGQVQSLLVRPPDPDYIPKKETPMPFRPAFISDEQKKTPLRGKDIIVDELTVEDLETISEYAMQGIVYVFRSPVHEIFKNNTTQDIINKLLIAVTADGARSEFKQVAYEIFAKILTNDEQTVTVEDLKKGKIWEVGELFRKLVEINTNFFSYISFVLPEELIAVISILVGKFTNIKIEMRKNLSDMRQSLEQPSSEKKEKKKASPKAKSEKKKSEGSDGGTSTGSKRSSSPLSKKTAKATSKS